MEQTIKTIQERLKNSACRAKTASHSDGTIPVLVAVSKTVGVEEIRHAYSLGIRDFGENRVQSALPKIEALRGDCPDIHWHMIGHLQRNKVKFVVGNFDLVHGVDSLRLAEEISARAASLGLVQKILLEVSISGEEAKFGLTPGEVREMAPALKGLGNIDVVGLMTMAPFDVGEDVVRPVFAGLRELRDEINDSDAGLNLEHLSMGMTDDYEIAVEEGATIVRIGRAIFS